LKPSPQKISGYLAGEHVFGNIKYCLCLLRILLKKVIKQKTLFFMQLIHIKIEIIFFNFEDLEDFKSREKSEI